MQTLKQLAIIFLAAISLAACENTARTTLFGDASLISTTSLYKNEKIFYLRKPSGDGNRLSTLADFYQAANDSELTARAVKNGDPVTITINSAYIPADSDDPATKTALQRLIGNRKTRDIAVLVDFGATAGQSEQFIAVWYQRNVPAETILQFRNLVVYSQDIWVSTVPPFFRLRIVDVSLERNAQTREVLDQVGKAAPVLANLASVPLTSAALSIGLRAAQLVFANEDNKMLVDVSFNLFGKEQGSNAGGMPMGQFSSGGMVIFGQPIGSGNAFWEADFTYDFKLRRIQGATKSSDGKTGPTKDVQSPYLMATVITAKAAVPNVVKRRSAEITRTLSDPDAIQSNIQEIVRDAESLFLALQVAQVDQFFDTLPTAENAEELAKKGVAAGERLGNPEKVFLLNRLRHITGYTASSFPVYVQWFAKCRTTQFSAENKKFAQNNCTP